MKITLPITALAAVLGLALAGIPVTAHAQAAVATATGTATATASKATAAKKTKYSGILSAVDTTGNTMTITDKTVAPRTISITPTTKIKKDGKTATLADFKVGDKVGGTFTTDATGTLTAVTLNASAAKKAKTAAAASPAAQ